MTATPDPAHPLGFRVFFLRLVIADIKQSVLLLTFIVDRQIATYVVFVDLKLMQKTIEFFQKREQCLHPMEQRERCTFLSLSLYLRLLSPLSLSV